MKTVFERIKTRFVGIYLVHCKMLAISEVIVIEVSCAMKLIVIHETFMDKKLIRESKANIKGKNHYCLLTSVDSLGQGFQFSIGG